LSGEAAGEAAATGGAPDAWVGIPLRAAMGPDPDDVTETPLPGEIWLEALSRLPPPPRPNSMSLSSATISFEFGVMQRVGLHVGRLSIGFVEAARSSSGALEIFGLLADTRMELSRPIAWNLTTFWLRPPSPNPKIFSELGNQRFRRAVAPPGKCDRLSLHPVGVEAQDGVDRAARRALRK